MSRQMLHIVVSKCRYNFIVITNHIFLEGFTHHHFAQFKKCISISFCLLTDNLIQCLLNCYIKRKKDMYTIWCFDFNLSWRLILLLPFWSLHVNCSSSLVTSQHKRTMDCCLGSSLTKTCVNTWLNLYHQL